MKLKYNAWMKEVITEALKEEIEYPLDQVPEKIIFEGIEYSPGDFLEEIQRRTPIGEAFLQRIYDSGKKQIEQGLDSFLENEPDKPFCDVSPPHQPPTRRERYEEISTEIEGNTESGKSYLSALFQIWIRDFFPNDLN